jgi:hypothetical protein
MAPISTKAHAAADYVNGFALLTAPNLLAGVDWRARGVLRGVGAMTLVTSTLTDYELGVRRRMPMPVHLTLDAATGALLRLAVPGLRRRSRGLGGWLPHALVGAGEIAMASLTARQPGAKSGLAVTGPVAEPAPEVPVAEPAGSGPVPSPTAGSEASRTDRPGSGDEPRAMHKEVLPSDPAEARARAMAIDDPLVAREESAAAAAAGAIGGAVSSEVTDPALAPVYEAGGGEQDGWEAAEDELIQNASHDEGRAAPERDAFTPEVEADRSTAVYGEADHVPSTEVVSDPATESGDPGEGPGLSPERGSGIEPDQREAPGSET